MPILRSDFNLLTDWLDSLFNEAAQNAIADMVGDRLFDVKDHPYYTFDHVVVHSPGGIQRVADGQDAPTILTDEGNSITGTMTKYAGNVPITEGLRMFVEARGQDIVGIVKSVTHDAFDKIDQSYADTLLFGWDTSHTDVWDASRTSTGPDALALFSASHTYGVATSSRTYSNLLNDGTNNDPKLGRAAIVESRRRARTLLDPEGHVRPVNLDLLIVPARLEDLAERTIFSTQMSGTANNDTNPLKGKVKEVITWPRLDTRSNGTDTSEYWFLADSMNVGETLKSRFAKRPLLEPPEKVHTSGNWDYIISFWYTWLTGHAKYVFGSRGLN